MNHPWNVTKSEVALGVVALLTVVLVLTFVVVVGSRVKTGTLLRPGTNNTLTDDEKIKILSTLQKQDSKSGLSETQKIFLLEQLSLKSKSVPTLNTKQKLQLLQNLRK